MASEHATVMRRRRVWFDQLREAYTALWWVPAGAIPTIADAEARLAALREHGPTPYAFGRPFPPKGTEATPPSAEDWRCGV